VGAGILGSAVAHELARRNKTDWVVVDADLQGEFSSTERNAGGVRQLWHHPINIELSRRSIAFFESIAQEVGFHQKGYLWLYSKTTKAIGEQTWQTVQQHKLPYEKLSVQELRNLFPFINKTDDLEFAILGTKDGILNANAVKDYYRKTARSAGLQFLDRVWVKSLKEKGRTTELKVQRLNANTDIESLLTLKLPETEWGKSETWEADRVIVCGGAWAKLLLQPLAAEPEIQPIRRQIAFFKCDQLDMSPYGMVVDSSGVYFHAEGGNILSGYVLKNEVPGFNLKYDSNFFEDHIWPKLYERASVFESLKPVNGWAGLYSYTPDTSGILGRVPHTKNIFELHSLTGRGVMQSHGAAVAMADLIEHGDFRALDATCLSRDRFAQADKSKWLSEALHI